LKYEIEIEILLGAMKYKHFCAVNCSSNCYKTIVSRMTALTNILATSLVFLNHLIFLLVAKYIIPT
jgi:hypothetical protein